MALYGTFLYGAALYGTGSVTPVTTIITLAEAKDWLKKTSTSDDARITELLEVVSETCEKYTRKTWRSQTLTETFDVEDDTPFLVLPHVPVASVSSVTLYGSTLDAGSYTLGRISGRLWAGRNTDDGCWPEGVQHITVTYVAAPASVPAHIKHGCKLLLAHMWESQRGGSNLPRQAGGEEQIEATLSFLPPRVRQAWGQPRVLVR